MLILSNTSAILQVVTGSVGAIAVHVSYVDMTIASQVIASAIGVNTASITAPVLCDEPLAISV